MSDDTHRTAAVQEQAGDAAQGDAAGARPPIPDDLAARVEAAVLISERAISASRLAEAFGGIAPAAVREAIEALNDEYGRTGRSFRIEEVAGGYQVLTLPQYADVLDALQKGKPSDKLSAAAVETLAIVAYKQPIIRAEVESIRGVACGEVLRSLLEKRLVKVVGRADEIGRPMLYGTTKRFLEVFGLSSLKDLPQSEEARP